MKYDHIYVHMYVIWHEKAGLMHAWLPFLCIGVTNASFLVFGKTEDSRDFLNKIHRGMHNC